ncbi:MAG: BLUF domain-containing protein [Chloroflexaceae bacterium]|nr:BLUF domain-containing protein [Chloroflexaceae bacterium]
MNLCRLIYSSCASPDLGYRDLLDIMEKSEKNNSLAGITGQLCYGDAMFLQILEGDRESVSKTYHRIVSDERHHTPELIECVPIESRLFAVWSMRAVKLGELHSDKVKQLILKYSPSTQFQPSNMTPQQCLNLMEELVAL